MPAATSASSSLTLTSGNQPASGDDAPVSTHFATVLDSTVTTGKDGSAKPTPAPKEDAGDAERQPAGKAAGKKLPPDAAAAGATTAASAKSAAAPAAKAKSPDGSKDDAAAADDDSADPAAPTLAPIIVLPGIVLPIAVQTPQAPAAAARSTADALATTAAAQALRSPPTAANDAKAKTKADTAAATPSAAAAAKAAPVIASVVLPKAIADLAPDATGPAAAATTAATTDPRLTLTSANAAPVPGEVRVTVTPAQTPQTPLQPAQPVAVPTATQLASAQEIGRAVTAKPADKTAAAPAPREAAAKDATAASAKPAKAAALDALAAAPATPAPTAPAVAAPQDGLSLSQSVTPSAPAAGGQAQTGHDFAALVDRLVEARNSATPASVHAAVAHSDFGRVSLRFDQDAGGLSVAMSSADPGFARAVQASASSVGSQMTGDNGSAAQRHGQDTSGQDASRQQQAAGSPTGQSQSQSQAQSQAYARDDRTPQAQTASRAGRQNGPQPRRDDTADTRGGIYA